MRFFHFKSPREILQPILKPLGWMLSLSILYNVAYFYSAIFIDNAAVLYVLIVLLSMISALGFYRICTQFWDRPFQLTTSVVLPVLAFQGILLLLTLGILNPLHNMIVERDIWFVSLIYQIFTAIVVVLLVPMQLCLYAAVCEGHTGLKDILAFAGDIVLHRFKEIWNRYCLILLIMVFVDSFIGGAFSFAGDFDAYTILQTILLFGNPLFSCMLAFFMGAGIGFGTSGVVYVLILLLVGLLYAVAMGDFLYKVGQTWIDHGTDKVKAHKKKK